MHVFPHSCSHCDIYITQQWLQKSDWYVSLFGSAATQCIETEKGRTFIMYVFIEISISIYNIHFALCGAMATVTKKKFLMMLWMDAKYLVSKLGSLLNGIQ